MNKTPTTRGSTGAARLSLRLLRLAQGWLKHKADPGAPALLATSDWNVLRQQLDQAAMDMLAQRALSRQATGRYIGQRTMALTQYGNAVTALKLWLGKSSTTLEDFGIKPEVVRRGKPHPRKAKATAGAATPAATAPGTPTTPKA